MILIAKLFSDARVDVVDTLIVSARRSLGRSTVHTEEHPLKVPVVTDPFGTPRTLISKLG